MDTAKDKYGPVILYALCPSCGKHLPYEGYRIQCGCGRFIAATPTPPDALRTAVELTVHFVTPKRTFDFCECGNCALEYRYAKGHDPCLGCAIRSDGYSLFTFKKRDYVVYLLDNCPCGNKCSDGDKYCSRCGRSLKWKHEYKP